jgi:hypothetical protein
MAKKEKRTRAEQILHLQRAIDKFGDFDGSRTKILRKLMGKDWNRPQNKAVAGSE